MKELIFLCLIIYSFGSPIPKCLSYSCDGKFSNANGCLKYSIINETSKVFLRKCSDNKICDSRNTDENNEALCSPYYELARKYPGEYCKNNTECYSYKCVNNICAGNPNNSYCNNDAYCDKGLYCLDYECVPTSNTDCNDKKKCSVNLVCDDGKCIKIGSKDIKKRATVPSACSTFYLSEEGICAKGPNLVTKGPNPIKCKYSDKSENDPICGMNSKGDTYCNNGAGDIDFTDVIFNYE